MYLFRKLAVNVKILIFADQRFMIIWSFSQTWRLERSGRKALIKTLSTLCKKIIFNLAPGSPLCIKDSDKTIMWIFNLVSTYWTCWIINSNFRMGLFCAKIFEFFPNSGNYQGELTSILWCSWFQGPIFMSM